jgi:hypothetical protein
MATRHLEASRFPGTGRSGHSPARAQSCAPGDAHLDSVDRGDIQPARDDPRITSKHAYWEMNGQVSREIVVG